MNKTELIAVAEKVYRYMLMEHPAQSTQLQGVDANPASWGMDINDWEWNPGVGVTSILAYYQACKKPEVLDYLIHWVKKNRHKAQKFQHVNVMAPFAIFPDLYRLTGDPYYKDTALEYGDWIIQNSARTMTGAFQHGGNLTEEIWADTIFMVVLFLARLARLVGDVKIANEVSNQLLLHLQYLQDPDTGVLFHGYFCQYKNHQSSARWTRGNAWITVGTPMILSEIREMVTIPDEIYSRYRRMVEGLIRFQASNGLWHTVMDRPDFYQETSGSAGIGCGILKSIHQGILPEKEFYPCVEKALSGVLSKITPEGRVEGVSGGTPIMKTIEEYGMLSQYPTLYGQGLSLMLLSEYIYSSLSG